MQEQIEKKVLDMEGVKMSKVIIQGWRFLLQKNPLFSGLSGPLPFGNRRSEPEVRGLFLVLHG